jgi:hypothetical protein
MSADQSVRQQLLALLRGGQASMKFGEAVGDFPMDRINERPPNVSYSPWQLLEHMRITQWDILEFIRNPAHVSPPWPTGYWPAPGSVADEEMWRATIVAFEQDHDALEELVEDPATDLYADLPHAPGYNILREILVVSDHNAYHLGEFAILRQVMGTWSRRS